jgi:hypothetical protein
MFLLPAPAVLLAMLALLSPAGCCRGVALLTLRRTGAAGGWVGRYLGGWVGGCSAEGTWKNCGTPRSWHQQLNRTFDGT